MRIFILAISATLFISCNNSGSDKTNNGDTTAGPDSNGTIEMPVTENDTIFTAFGNEPFWALYVIRGQKLLFHPMDGPDVEAPYVEPTEETEGTRRYTSAGDSATIELQITRRDCSDGMSDVVHRFETNVKVNAITYKGCGRE